LVSFSIIDSCGTGWEFVLLAHTIFELGVYGTTVGDDREVLVSFMGFIEALDRRAVTLGFFRRGVLFQLSEVRFGGLRGDL
jgi:hypothetical protein